jgi:hypothetical protein
MRRIDRLLLGATVLGIVLNVVLVFRPATTKEAGCASVPTPVAYFDEAAVDGIHALLDSASCRKQLAACDLQTESCHRVLSACLAETAASSPPQIRFETGEPHRALEQIAAPLLARHFDALEGLDWSLECRDDVCRIDVVHEESIASAVAETMIALQQDERITSAFPWRGFEAGYPTNDGLTGIPLRTETVYLAQGTEPGDAEP